MNFDKFGVMVDCSRNSVMNVRSVKKLIDLLSAMGYNTIQLYTEDTYEVNNEPYFGYLRGRYSKSELKEIDAYAASKQMELIPCVQTLAHIDKIFRWAPYAPIRDCHDILLVGNERVYELIDNIFSTLAECFTSRNVNIGMDEAHMLGLGRYLDEHGYKNRHDIMLEHLKRVSEIAEKYGFRCAMWSDMFFRLAFGRYHVPDAVMPEEVMNRVPKNVDLIYWDYYGHEVEHYDCMMKHHNKFGNNIIFAGGLWTWRGLAPFNRYSLEATKAAFTACQNNGVKNVFLTMWGDNGGSCSPFSVMPSLFTASEFAKGNYNTKEIKRKFEEFFGIPFDVFMYADLPNILSDKQDFFPFNPSKYMFYSDCLLGMHATTFEKGVGEIYKKHVAKLKRAEKNKDWAFVFAPLRALCEVLYYKADLGLRTRDAYRAGDKAALNALITSSYKPAIKKIRLFHKTLSAYWDTIFKPHGFDVMDIRIGGVLQRLEHVVEKISAYTSGQVDRIEELDEELLDFFGNEKEIKKELFPDNNFAYQVTVNTL